MEYYLTLDLSIKPNLKFRDGNSKSKYDMLNFHPYEKPTRTQFVVVSLEDHNVSVKQEEINNFFTANNNAFPFRNTLIKKFDNFFESNLNYIYINCKENDLINIASIYPNSIILVIHRGRSYGSNNRFIKDKIYYHSKINAITNGSRIQYISYNNLKSDNNYKKFNLWTSLIAKCDGTPWIIDNSTLQFIDNDTIILGIAFSIVNKKLRYGVAHFMDINNMNEEVILNNIGEFSERKLDFPYLNKDELIKILKRGIGLLNSKNPSMEIKGNKKLKLFIYKTTPLHPDEEKAIKTIVENPNILNYDCIDITHIHIKSFNYGIPRLFDLSNTENSYPYMNRQGTSIGIILDNTKTSGFQLRGELIIGTTGTFKNEYNNSVVGIKGSPKPIFLSIHSTIVDPFKMIKNQVMALTEMDLEYTGENYREPFMIKYAHRLSILLSYIQIENNFRSNINIRDIM